MYKGIEIRRFENLIMKFKRKEKNLNELLLSENGSAFWEEHGFTWYGNFDLTYNSENLKILHNYIARFNSENKPFRNAE